MFVNFFSARSVIAMSLALALALAAVGCRHIPMTPRSGTRPPMPAALAAQFAVTGSPLVCVRTEKLKQAGTITVQRFEFRAPADEFGTNHPVVVDTYLPAEPGPRPVILIRPISGSWYLIEAHIAREFAANGYAAVVMHRREADHPPLTGVAINAFFREAIIDTRRVLDWMETRPEFDPARIGFFGASAGGIEGAALTPVDLRVQASVLAFAAGDIADVYATTLHWRYVLFRNEVMRERRITLEEMKDEFRLTFTCDPLRLAPYVDPGRVLMILARWDTAVPFKHGWELREAMGSPETHVLPAGHILGFAAAPYLESKALDFFRRKFADAGPKALVKADQ